MRNVYLVAYDVADAKRLRRTYQKMKGFGEPLQFSVFYCELSASERQCLKEELWEILEFEEDRVLVVDLGPVGGRGQECMELWGQPRAGPPPHVAVIV